MRSDARPPLERWLSRAFGDAGSRRFGTGWSSGTASIFLGAVSALGVLAFWFPGVFSSAELRTHYPLPQLRALLELCIAAAFALGALSLALRPRKALGATGVALALAAALAGGGEVPLESDFAPGPTLGLDWFLLNLLLLALLFVPLERAFALRRAQTSFRFGWTTDGAHFLASHLGVQALAFATLLPATWLARAWQPEALQQAIRGQPLWLQTVESVCVADLAQYWIHRAFHRVPWLWRFHAVHHSSRALDWLAGSRLHPLDAVATRALVLVPVLLLGFAQPAVYAYLVFVSFHAVFLHANLRFRFRALERVLATPRLHHWHHALAPADRNFAVHLPALDALFGTLHLPGDAWPEGYGLPGHPVPEGWWAQLVHPLQSARAREDGSWTPH